MLECEGLRKTYGRKTAVAGVDLHVRAGRVVGLLGPNGAGKSTLLKMVTGLIWPDEGAALINGYDVQTERRQALAQVGAVIEWPAFYPYLSARENIRAITGLRSRAFDAKIEEAADLVGMRRWLEGKVQTFSTGMKQRIGIALACLPDSRFIILDEPANGLDPNGMIELREVIRNISRERGATVLVSSHLLGEIEKVCDEVAIMHNGSVAACGEVAALVGDKGALQVGVGAADAARAEAVFLRQALSFSALDKPGMYALAAGQEQAAELNRQLLESGCSVWHLAYRPRTLEDVFQEITGGARDVD